jgi:hypothetical protein
MATSVKTGNNHSFHVGFLHKLIFALKIFFVIKTQFIYNL